MSIESISTDFDHDDPRASPEHALMFAALETYFTDVKNPYKNEQYIEQLLEGIQSPWTLTICNMIDFDHKFLVEKFKEHIEEMKEIRKAKMRVKDKYSIYSKEY